MSERVLLSVDQGIAHVRLNRPERMNALDRDMFSAIIRVADSLKRLKGLRAVVLSGEGRAFCAGLDRSLFRGQPSQDPSDPLRLTERIHGDSNTPQYVAMVWREIPVPVIAAVHGVALGGGLQIALGADLRFAHPQVQLSLMEIRWGIIPDMGASILLPELLPGDQVRDMFYTAKSIGGTEALSLGLVTRLSEDPIAQALEHARAIASVSPDAVRAAKQLLDGAWSRRKTEQLERETSLQLSLLGRPNQREAVLANIEQRPARFADS